MIWVSSRDLEAFIVSCRTQAADIASSGEHEDFITGDHLESFAASLEGLLQRLFCTCGPRGRTGMPVISNPPPVDPAALAPFLARHRERATELRAAGRYDDAGQIEMLLADLEHEIGWLMDRHATTLAAASGDTAVTLTAEGEGT